MYSINPLSRFTIITPDECTHKLPGVSLDSKKWIAAIELAEIRFVIPLLGYSLYTDICNDKNVYVDSGNIGALQALINTSFSANKNPTLAIGNIVNSPELGSFSPAYKMLWNQALWNYIYNCVYFIALTENYAQFTSSGVVKANPLDSSIGEVAKSSTGISLSDLRYLNDRWLFDRINPLQDYVELTIFNNLSSFPLYPREKCAHRDSDGNKRTTSFINIYDEEDDCRNRRGCNSGSGSIPMPPIPTPIVVTSTCSMKVKIATTPDGSLIMLCNLKTIQAQYPVGNTLTIPSLVGKYVNVVSEMIDLQPVSIPYDITTGTFDASSRGGFADGEEFSFMYTETMG